MMRAVVLPGPCQARSSRAAALLALCVVACARTGLEPGDWVDNNVDITGPASGGASGGAAGSANGGAAGSPSSTVAGSPSSGGAAPCLPRPEICNGKDDDCNGAVDDLPAQACPGGGERFCVAGRLSACPRRCEVCVPGSARVCQNSFCSFWGEQECAADGQGFGHCREATPPPECRAVAKKFEDSKELEQCCIDNGYCCLDQFDLDQDGDRREMLGTCGDVVCQ